MGRNGTKKTGFGQRLRGLFGTGVEGTTPPCRRRLALEPLESRTLLALISISPSGSQWTIDERMSTTPNPPLDFTVSCVAENGEDLSCMQQLVRVNLGIGGTAGSSDFFDTACDDNGQSFVWVPASGGDTSFSIIPINDAIGEGDETIEVSLSGVDASLAYCDGTCDSGCGGCCGGGIHEVNYHLDTNQLPSTITIQDDDNWAIKAVRTSADAGIVERTRAAAFSFLRVDDGSGRSGDTNYAIAVDYAMSGDAVEGVDYYLTEAPDGTGVGLTTINDHWREADEMATLVVNSAQSVPDQYGRFAGGVYGKDTTSPDPSVMILDDDHWYVSLVKAGMPGSPKTVIYEEDETSGSLLLSRIHEVMTPVRTGDTSYPIDVAFTYSGQASGSDYRMIEYAFPTPIFRLGETPSFEIEIGETQKAIDVQAIDDSQIERLNELLVITATLGTYGGETYPPCLPFGCPVEFDIRDNDKLELFSMEFGKDELLRSDPDANQNSVVWQTGLNWHTMRQLGPNPTTDYVPVAYSSSAVPEAQAWWKPADVDPAIAGDLYIFFEADINGVRYSGERQLIQLSNGYWRTVLPAALTATFAAMQGQVADYRENFQTRWHMFVAADAAGFGGVTPGDGLSPDEQSVIRHTGDAESCLYVTYKKPIMNTGDGFFPQLYHTVVHTGCVAAKGITGDSAVFDAIWAKFETKSIPKINIENGAIVEGNVMRYYGPEAFSRDVAIEASIRGLLAFEYGRCGAWTQFLGTTLWAQGIGIGATFGGLEPVPQEYQGSMVTPIAVTVKEAVDGQGGEPGWNFFLAPNVHEVIRYGDRIYDPSYGLDFDTLNAWEDALLDELVLPGNIYGAQRVGIEDLKWQTD